MTALARPPPAKIEKKPAKSRHRVEKIGDGLSHGHDAQPAIKVTASSKRFRPPSDVIKCRSMQDHQGGLVRRRCDKQGAHIEAALGGCAVASGLGKAMAKGLGVRASLPNDDPKEVATLGALEGPHFVPSGNQRDPYGDPFYIASDALKLGIHGGGPFL